MIYEELGWERNLRMKEGQRRPFMPDVVDQKSKPRTLQHHLAAIRYGVGESPTFQFLTQLGETADSKLNAFISRPEISIGSLKTRGAEGESIKGDQAGGHGIWCPVDQYLDLVDTFCQNAAGTDVHLNHETSDTFGISLTNQDGTTAPGAAANLVCKSRTALQLFTFLVAPLSRSTFGKTEMAKCQGDSEGEADSEAVSIYNTKSPTYVVNKADDVDYMQKQSNMDSRCYGKNSNDTEGGYWKVDSVGTFGSEVWAGASPS